MTLEDIATALRERGFPINKTHLVRHLGAMRAERGLEPPKRGSRAKDKLPAQPAPATTEGAKKQVASPAPAPGLLTTSSDAVPIEGGGKLLLFDARALDTVRRLNLTFVKDEFGAIIVSDKDGKPLAGSIRADDTKTIARVISEIDMMQTSTKL